jgi:hypothetical protein
VSRQNISSVAILACPCIVGTCPSRQPHGEVTVSSHLTENQIRHKISTLRRAVPARIPQALGGNEVMGSALTMREVEAVDFETEVINSAELAKRLGVPESWVRSRSNPKRTSDPIPHYKLGRYINFPWGSSVLREWLDRQLVGANRNRSGRRPE